MLSAFSHRLAMRLDLFSVVQSYFFKIPSPHWQTAVGPHMVHGSLAWFCSHTFSVNGMALRCVHEPRPAARWTAYVLNIRLCQEFFNLHQIPIDYPVTGGGHMEIGPLSRM